MEVIKESFTGPVRRMDSRLKVEYPELETKIYFVGRDTFYIQCINAGSRFAEIKEHFDRKVKYITSRVGLVETPPNFFVNEVPVMTDRELEGGLEGLYFTPFDIINTLTAKFPKVHFYKTSLRNDGVVLIHVASFKEEKEGTIYSRFLSNDQRQKVMQFLANLNSLKFEITEDELPDCPVIDIPEFDNPVFNIHASNLNRKQVLEFSQRDEALWFDNIENIFNRTVTKKDLYFYTPNEYSCYLDYGTFKNIDLRNNLFLFQTIFLSPPHQKDLSAWLKQNKMYRAEFIGLIRENRVKLILTHPESWYDISLLREAYEANKNGVITRRAIAALQQIDIVKMAGDYLLNDERIAKEVSLYINKMSKKLQYDPDALNTLLMWPLRARKQSFTILNQSGCMGVSNYGINKAIEKDISKILKTDLSFEFTVTAPQIHIAHALNATYFPFKTDSGHTDLGFASIMGEYLNFFEHLRHDSLVGFSKMKQELKSGVQQISPIEVVDIDDRISILEVEKVLNKNTVFPNSYTLMETLSKLSKEERAKKIAYYNEEVAKKINRRQKSSGLIDLATDLLADKLGLGIILGIFNSIFSIAGLEDKIPPVGQVSDKITEVFSVNPDKANIHYLTKINRVAKIRRNFDD